ncbi:MAG: metal-dependent hydrolase [Pirellulales bacterium]|nr:metal-dependent hydrolase [Pirellulales bacterium]
MTIYEHAMVGVNGALAAGLQRRYGWQIVAWAGLASLLPDADGLTLLFGPWCYSTGHRIWTHNFLAVGIAAAVLSAIVYQSDVFTKLEKGDILLYQKRKMSPFWLWLAVGVSAAYVHLLIDVFYSGGRGLPVWGVPLFWPFSETRYARPVVTWGDLGATLIFTASMFAMLRWKKRIQPIAAASLLAVAAYMLFRGLVW